jgi:hypothetical protein
MQTKYYVYEHISDNTNKVFYVGCGSLTRAHSKNKGSRNSEWWETAKYGFKINIIGSYLDKSMAFNAEAITIKKHGLENLTNKTEGGLGLNGFHHSDATKNHICITVKSRSERFNLAYSKILTARQTILKEID